MAKYKIYNDRPKISEEEAQKHMDFDFVLKQSQKGIHSPLYILKNIYKKPKLMRRIILIMIIILAVLFSYLDDKKEEKNKVKEKMEEPIN